HVFFFFQAEDGIRDFHVTGVQTCALPIYGPGDEQAVGVSRRGHELDAEPGKVEDHGTEHVHVGLAAVAAARADLAELQRPAEERSEERRVGKEGRCRWWAR